MKEEFNLSKNRKLSNWVLPNGEKIYIYSEIDIKEFIKLLKKELIEALDLKTTYPKDMKIVMNLINKLAGKKLL